MLDAWTVNGVRYSVATLFWLPFVLYRGLDPDLRGVWRDAIRPAFVNVVGQVSFAWAPYYTDASVMGFVLRMSFVFTIVFSYWMLHEERLLLRRPLFWYGAAVIIAGVVALHVGGWNHGGTSAVGLVLLLNTTICAGFYVVFVRKYMAPYPVRLSFGVTSLYSAIGLMLLMFMVGDWEDLSVLRLPDWGWLVLSAIMGIAVAHVLYFRAIHALGPVVTSGALSVVPVTTAIGALLVLGECMMALQWLGGAFAVAGSLLLVRAKMKAEAP